MSKADAELRLQDLNQGKWEGKNFLSSYLTFYYLNQSDLEDVIRVAESFRAHNQKLDVLLCNAGLWIRKAVLTTQGYAQTFAVNHLSHMLLVDKLYSLLKSTPDSRVVNVSSIAARPNIGISSDPSIDLEDIMNLKAKNFDGNQDYGESKFANILFTKGLHIFNTEVSNVQSWAFSLHPGVISSSLFRDFNCFLRAMTAIGKPLLMTEFEGAQNNIFCSIQDHKKLRSGDFYNSMKIQATYKKADSKDYQKAFWNKSVELINEKVSQKMTNLTTFK